mmetsp:Transcript_107819/g.310544  ORF Transcript_107819/g.310544 Transcript_107819/m.310544 type:complete len:570 (-) Transcript_107819:92-1801(-)
MGGAGGRFRPSAAYRRQTVPVRQTVAPLPEAVSMEALRKELETARRERLQELGVCDEAIAASELKPLGAHRELAEVTVEPPRKLGVVPRSASKGSALDAPLRVMQFNVLADGLSDDGFLVRPVLKDWPVGLGQVPSASGEAVEYRQVLDAIMAAKGDEEALLALKAKFSLPITKRNCRAVADWTARELQIQLLILAADRPDILIFQELDHFGSMSESLHRLGYSSQLPGCRTRYRPAHLDGFGANDGEQLKTFVKQLQDAGHTFLPSLGSTCMSIALQSGEHAQGMREAISAQGYEPELIDEARGGLKKRCFNGFAPGTEGLLRAAGIFDEADPARLDDDGIAVFWREDRLTAEGFEVHFPSPVWGCGVLEARLRTREGRRQVTVISAHLASGSKSADEDKRLSQEVAAPGGLADVVAKARRQASQVAAHGQRPAVVVALDANAYPQLRSKDGKSSVYSSLRDAAGASVWDDHFGPNGEELSAEAGVLQAPVTSNKLRGPDSDQPRKIGEHAYSCIDHIFFDPGSMELQAHVLPPQRFPSQEAALECLQPSLRNPSDHFPVIVDLRWRP